MKRNSGAVVGWQIVASDPDVVAGFYRDLFGWQLSSDNALGYRQLRSGSRGGMEGGVWPAPAGAPTFVQLVIEVEDLAARADRAVAAGARVIVPPSALPDGDTIAVLADPAGVSFVLRASRKV